MNEREKSAWRRPLLVALAATLPFLPGLRSPYFFDDLNTFTRNPAIANFDCFRFFTDATAFSVKFGNWPYRPLLLVVNALQFKLFAANPFPGHLFQLFLHLLNSLLVMVMAEKVFGLRKGALFAGVLFAIAPLQTQAVIYLSARSMVLAFPPALIAVIAAAQAAKMEKGQGRGFFWLALIAPLFAFFSSEGSLALVLWLTLVFIASGISLQKRPAIYLLCAVAMEAVIFLIVRGMFSAPDSGPSNGVFHPYSFFQQFFLELRTPLFMARLLAWPVHLSLLHDAAAPQSVMDLSVLLPFLGLGMVFLILIVFRRHRPLSLGLCWYLAALLPAVMVPLNIPWAEHRAYLALPGLAVAAAWVLEKILSLQEGSSRRWASALSRIMIAVIIACLALLSAHRSWQWESPQEIFKDAAKNAPEYDVPWNFLAAIAHDQGNCPRALTLLDLAIRRNPAFADAYNTRADCLLKLGRLPEAGLAAKKATELDPQNATYWNSLAVVLSLEKKWEEAEKASRTALDFLAPDDPNRPVIEETWRLIQQNQQALKSGP